MTRYVVRCEITCPSDWTAEAARDFAIRQMLSTEMEKSSLVVIEAGPEQETDTRMIVRLSELKRASEATAARERRRADCFKAESETHADAIRQAVRAEGLSELAPVEAVQMIVQRLAQERERAALSASKAERAEHILSLTVSAAKAIGCE